MPCKRADYENVNDTLWHLNTILAHYTTRPTLWRSVTVLPTDELRNGWQKRRAQLNQTAKSCSGLSSLSLLTISWRCVLFLKKIEACFLNALSLALCLHHKSKRTHLRWYTNATNNDPYRLRQWHRLRIKMFWTQQRDTRIWKIRLRVWLSTQY